MDDLVGCYQHLFAVMLRCLSVTPRQGPAHRILHHLRSLRPTASLSRYINHRLIQLHRFRHSPNRHLCLLRLCNRPVSNLPCQEPLPTPVHALHHISHSCRYMLCYHDLRIYCRLV